MPANAWIIFVDNHANDGGVDLSIKTMRTINLTSFIALFHALSLNLVDEACL